MLLVSFCTSFYWQEQIKVGGDDPSNFIEGKQWPANIKKVRYLGESGIVGGNGIK